MSENEQIAGELWQEWRHGEGGPISMVHTIAAALAAAEQRGAQAGILAATRAVCPMCARGEEPQRNEPGKLHPWYHPGKYGNSPLVCRAAAIYDLIYEAAAEARGAERALARVRSFAVAGLAVDGEHHKQFFLERIAQAAGADLSDTAYEKGIAP